MSNPTHEIILASAGSGKTYTLAHRYLHLLVHDAAPERILALTFSRKAAGEITENILAHLLVAIRNPAAMAKVIQHSELGQAELHAILTRLLQRLNRMGTGTLDSFLVSILQAFPLELKLPPSIRFMENGSHAANQLRQATLGRILDPRRLSPVDRDTFMAAFHRSIGGRADASVTELIQNFIAGGLDALRELPDDAAWGDPSRIWAAGDVQNLLATPPGKDEAAEWSREVDETLAGSTLHKTLVKSLARFAGACAAYDLNAASVPDPLDSAALRGLIQALQEATPGEAIELTYSKKPQPIPARVATLFQQLVGRVLRLELQKSLVRTRGVFDILTAYEAAYADSIRATGLMTFADAQHLLGQSRDTRLNIDYRLDGRIDHWLLDEFQDTSDAQWSGLEPLIDEVISDSSASRTFFMVGDVKQSIHGWRGGNPWLAQSIVERYGIAPHQLPRSFRSCPVIIETVNRCFGNLTESGLPPSTIQRWTRQWQDHTTAVDGPGQVCLFEVVSRDDEEETPEPGLPRHQAVLDILRHLNPVATRQSVAILTRSNPEAAAMAAYLRQTEPALPVQLEGTAPFLDNRVAETLLAVIGYALHPGDSQAWQLVAMSPLFFAIQRLGESQDGLPFILLRDLHERGLPVFIRYWGGQMEEAAGTDPEAVKWVTSQLVLAAHRFLQTAAPLEDFPAYIRESRWTPPGEAGAVSILTIHRSKGLGFDVVILPELDTHNHVMNRTALNGVVTHRDQEDSNRNWRLYIPPRRWAEMDSVLRKSIEEQDAVTAYDELCVLYVALTRAKRGLYILVPPIPKEDATGIKPSAFLRAGLTGATEANAGFSCRARCLYAHGDANWHIQRVQPAEQTAAPIAPLVATAPLGRSLTQVEPSKTADTDVAVAWMFDDERADVLAFGTAIHELLASVEWSETADAKRMVDEWLPRAACSDSVRRHVLDRFETCMTQPELRHALARPAGAVTLWREKSFELILNDRLVHGIFDRVVIHGDFESPTHAEILDFKSDRVDAIGVPTRAELHRDQMILYRSALARILRLPEAAITCRLIFVVPGIIVDCA